MLSPREERGAARTAGPSLAILQRLEVRLWKVGDSHFPAVELAVGERLERRGGLLGGRPAQGSG